MSYINSDPTYEELMAYLEPTGEPKDIVYFETLAKYAHGVKAPFRRFLESNGIHVEDVTYPPDWHHKKERTHAIIKGYKLKPITTQTDWTTVGGI